MVKVLSVIQILKQSDANSVEVCRIARLEFDKLEKQYASSQLKFNIAADNSVFTVASADAVMEDLMLAIVLVAIVMFLFLHSMRNSFICIGFNSNIFNICIYSNVYI